MVSISPHPQQHVLLFVFLIIAFLICAFQLGYLPFYYHFMSSLYTLDTRSLSNIRFVNIVSHSVVHIFTFLIVSFEAQNILILTRSTLSHFFSFVACGDRQYYFKWKNSPWKCPRAIVVCQGLACGWNPKVEKTEFSLILFLDLNNVLELDNHYLVANNAVINTV